MADVKVVEKNGNLVITIPMNSKPEVSKSGKSRVVATTNGFVKTDLEVKGKTVSLSLNAIVPLS